MSRSTKLILGFISFLPIILGIVIVVMIINMIPSFIEWDRFEPDPYEVFGVFGPVFMVGFFAGILSVALLIFFIMHLVRNKKMDSTERIIWVLVFLLAGGIGYPIYWYMRIWKDDL
jgi:uncharacterized membrane protein